MMQARFRWLCVICYVLSVSILLMSTAGEEEVQSKIRNHTTNEYTMVTGSQSQLTTLGKVSTAPASRFSSHSNISASSKFIQQRQVNRNNFTASGNASRRTRYTTISASENQTPRAEHRVPVSNHTVPVTPQYARHQTEGNISQPGIHRERYNVTKDTISLSKHQTSHVEHHVPVSNHTVPATPQYARHQTEGNISQPGIHQERHNVSKDETRIHTERYNNVSESRRHRGGYNVTDDGRYREGYNHSQRVKHQASHNTSQHYKLHTKSNTSKIVPDSNATTDEPGIWVYQDEDPSPKVIQSVGAVAYCHTKHGLKYLLLHDEHHAMRWMLPKATKRGSESNYDALHRKVTHDTGIPESQLDIQTTFLRRDKHETNDGFANEIVYYLMELREERFAQIPSMGGRRLKYKWVSLEEAVQSLYYHQSKRVLEEANEHILYSGEDNFPGVEDDYHYDPYNDEDDEADPDYDYEFTYDVDESEEKEQSTKRY